MPIIVSLNLAGKGNTMSIFSEVVIPSVPLCKCGSVGGLCLETMADDGSCGIFCLKFIQAL
jgi:hypothetical protein